ncbi:MAG: efflux RND transporter periplasmic adaptor subunit [Desulfobacteraceae bacterium]|nr:MAG: efflux RND transporter periplasmic adaptor subunit [Desulfobacteraceae bacterium]
MKQSAKIIMAVLIGIVVIVFAVLLLRHRKSELAGLPVPAVHPLPVHIKTADKGSLDITGHYLGTIEPVVETVLSAQTTGYVLSIHKDVGDLFSAGEPLAEIDNRLSIHQKAALEAELAGAIKNYEVKKTIRDRRKELYATSVVSKEAFEEADLDYESARSRMQRLQQDRDAADISLSFTQIRSLRNGIITARLKSPGDMVLPGTPVLKAEDPGRGYKVLVQVPLETITQLSEDTRATLIHGSNTVDAAVYRIHPAITSGSLATIEIRSTGRPFGLPSYGSIGVDLVLETLTGLIVSSDCILEQETGTWVFAVQDNRTVRPIPVTILGNSRGQAVMEGALEPGTPLAAGPESMLLQLSKHGQVIPISGGSQ